MTPPQEDRKPWLDLGAKSALSPRRELAAVGVLVLLAAALRAVRWERTAAIFNDGPTFLALSKKMAAGEWSEALAHDYHPLYSFLVWLAHLAIPDWEAAAAAVSIAAGAAAVAFLYLWLRDAFGWPAAWLGSALLCVHYRAVAYSSDVQSDGVFLMLFLAGLWLAWRALETRSTLWGFWAGAASGLAYLTRPEGLGVALVAAAIAGLELMRRHWRFAETARFVAAVAVGALLWVGPYLGFLRVEHGSWALTQKKSVTAMATLEAQAFASLPVPLDPAEGTPGSSPPAVSPWKPYVAAASLLQDKARSAARAETLIVLSLGLLVAAGRPGRRGTFVLVLVALYGVVLYSLALYSGYVSRRHVLPVLVTLFGYAGLGIAALGKLIAAALRPLGDRLGGGALAARATAIAMLAVAISALGGQLATPRAKSLANRRAAEWLRAQATDPGPVAASRLRIAYYAGASYVPLRIASGADALSSVRSQGARYVIADGDQLERLQIADDPGVRLLHRERAEGEEAQVFEVTSVRLIE